MIIRRAEEKDIDGIINLLKQVLEVHSEAYPDIFKCGTVKYTKEDLKSVLKNDSKRVFVAVEDNQILGHAFTVIQDNPETVNMYADKILYIDDICVDGTARGKHVGSEIFKYVKDYAKQNACTRITLNVWAKNEAAAKFYEMMGMEKLKTMMHIKLS